MAKQIRKIAAKDGARDVIALSAPVTIEAAAAEGDSGSKPAKFSVVAYTGGAMEIAGWEYPIVIDLAGLEYGNSLVANLDHERSQRVGNVTDWSVDGDQLTLAGVASAATPSRDEVVNSAANGFVWQASVEVRPLMMEEVPPGSTVKVNGQSFTGPCFVTRKGRLRGFAFVSHGADDNTSVEIAASADHQLESAMKVEVKDWIKKTFPSVDAESLTDVEAASFESLYERREESKPKLKQTKLQDLAAERQAEVERVDAITAMAADACDRQPYHVREIYAMAESAIEKKWTIDKFRLELLEAAIPRAHTVFAPREAGNRLTDQVLEAAICQAGNLKDYDKKFDDKTLQAAHDRFKGRIGLKQLFVLAAEMNGYRNGGASHIDIEVQRAAFGMLGPRTIQASGFSTISLPNVFSNVANKFLRQGWDAVDGTCLRVAYIRPVSDFKAITTISLTGGLMFEQVGPDGELKHGAVGERTYSNKADTYGRMFAITRTDIINDDLNALTAVPRRMGRGGKLKLNDIFWTEFLNNSTFFAAGNNNVSTGAGSALGLAGIQAAETVFMNQTDPDGYPLGAMPTTLLVPPTLKATALTLMNSQLTITGANTTLGNTNVWQGRFAVESSPYMENAAYTGYSAAAWYLLADPNDLPVIEIVALYGRVEPNVDTAEADFNVLGVQMRGYSDVGVNLQEFRGGVRSAGS